ncbi:sulfite exporter TauE/SafE family protein [Tabrizicola oligotrophica]|uniref:Probable membrane transporter protein n=1 Tax=Tabrizicola oligotrophica TaxID=2710650 RepID=A0A6M0QNX6_9RHOB|nr:sulfite exporter TauE/SafE family protein [Tabrizicola oligotrophica]NEY89107.1 sulfite exporter TauE/SafE family protein [Tabrizicola oligotrophica]
MPADLVTLLPMAVVLVLIGAFAGVVGGLLGVGGGIVLVPAFFYAFQSLGLGGDHLMQVCVGTSLATIVVTSIRSVNGHSRRGAVDWEVLKRWGPGLVIGAALGVLVAAQVKSLVLQAVFGGLAGVAGLYMAFGREHWRLGAAMPGLAGAGILSSVVGFFSALMGIGGGTFGVPLMSLYSLPIHRAVGTASGFGILIAVPAVLGFLMMPLRDAPPLSIGAVNLPAFAIVIGSTLVTTPWGVALAHRMDPRPLKRAFAVFLTLVALNMLRKVAFG